MKKRDTSDALVKNVYLSIGSNLGNRIHFLEKSKYLLETHDIKINGIDAVWLNTEEVKKFCP
ncbi:hypothetical protein AKH21_02905, partial [Pelagibacteraceae bacterium GOM-A5]